MQKARSILLVMTVCALLAAIPALAVPPCSAINSGDCAATCYIVGGGSCWGVSGGTCGIGSQPYTYHCSTGNIDGWCSCGGGGCFLSGTEITMADGTLKAIEDIIAGDIVLAYDEESGEMKPDEVKSVHDPVPAEHYLLVNGKIRLTAEHPVLSDGEWKEIATLKVGDALTSADGKVLPIETLETVSTDVMVYNFSVNPYETYVADGIIVHNKPPDIKEVEPNDP